MKPFEIINYVLFQYYFSRGANLDPIFLWTSENSINVFIKDQYNQNWFVELRSKLPAFANLTLEDFTNRFWTLYFQGFKGIIDPNAFKSYLDGKLNEYNNGTASIPQIFPIFAFFLMPIGESDEDIDEGRFYECVNKFAHDHGLPYQQYGSNMMRTVAINRIWEQLMDFVNKFNNPIQKYNYNIKYELVINGSHQYVLPFVRESLLYPSQERRFHFMFLRGHLSPKTEVSQNQILSLFRKYSGLLNLTNQDAEVMLSKYPTTVEAMFRRKFNSWDGPVVSSDDFSFVNNVLCKYYTSRGEDGKPIFLWTSEDTIKDFITKNYDSLKEYAPSTFSTQKAEELVNLFWQCFYNSFKSNDVIKDETEALSYEFVNGVFSKCFDNKEAKDANNTLSSFIDKYIIENYEGLKGLVPASMSVSYEAKSLVDLFWKCLDNIYYYDDNEKPNVESFKNEINEVTFGDIQNELLRKKKQLDERRKINLDNSASDYFFSEFVCNQLSLYDESEVHSIPQIFPFFTLLLLPFNDGNNDDSSFYKSINKFVKDKGLSIPLLDSAYFKKLVTKDLWDQLESFMKANDFNYEVKAGHTDANDDNQYVEPFRCEALFSQEQSNRFPNVFSHAYLSLGEDMTFERCKTIMLTGASQLGINPKKIEGYFDKFPNIVYEIFLNSYNSWDGNVVHKDKNIKDKVVKDEEVNSLSTFSIVPFLAVSSAYGCNFSFRMIAPSDSEYDEMSFNLPNKTLTVSFVNPDGYSDKLDFSKDEVLSILKENTRKSWPSTDSKSIRAFFSPQDFYLIRPYSQSVWSAKNAIGHGFQMGASYYILVRNDKYDTFSKWLKENTAEETENHPLKDDFRLFFIPAVKCEMQGHSLLSVNQQKSAKLENTLTIASSDNVNSLCKNFPARFAISGIDVKSQPTATYESCGKYCHKPLSYNEFSMNWELEYDSSISNHPFYITYGEANERLNNQTYRFEDFNLTNSYDEIGYNEFGTYETEESKQIVFGLELRGNVTSPETVYRKSDSQYLKSTFAFGIGPSPEFTNVPYDNCDYILYWLSAKSRCEVGDLKDVIKTLETIKYYQSLKTANNGDSVPPTKDVNVNFIIRDYCKLGYINDAYVNGKHIVAVNKPTLVLMPNALIKQDNKYIPECSWYKFLLTGARTPELMKKFTSHQNSDTLKVQIKPRQGMMPQQVIVWAKNADVVNNFSSIFGKEVKCQFCIYSYDLCKHLDNINDFFEKVVSKDIDDYDYSDYSEAFTRCIDYAALGNSRTVPVIDAASINHEHSVVTYNYLKHNSFTVYWKDNVQYRIDKKWGYFFGLKDAGNKDFIYIDNDNKELVIKNMEIDFPSLYARCLSLYTGDKVSFKNGMRIYSLVNNDVVINNYIKPLILDKLK